MRNFIACLLLLGLLAGLSACGADDSYLSVRTHVEPSIPATETPQQEEPPTAGNRSELRGAMLSFVRNWTEQGEIRISGYSGDLTADLTETVRYITQEDPIGAYAVDYADAELRGDAQTGTVEVSIVFRRSAAEIDAIVTVSGVNGAHAKIRQALANFDAALTLRIRSYEDADFSGYIRTYCLEHPDSAMALPEVSAAVYPETGETRILELHFTYSQPRDTLRSMQAAVNTILDSAAAYVESGTTPRRCAELLARFLLTRFTYTTAEETPDMPAYDLLSSGRAHSLSFASVFYAECTRAGLACRLVSGTRGSETHWWNLLQLEETWYAVDLMRSVEQGGDSLDLLDPAALRDEGYDWDAEAYPSNPAPEPEEPTEP